MTNDGKKANAAKARASSVWTESIQKKTNSAEKSSSNNGTSSKSNGNGSHASKTTNTDGQRGARVLRRLTGIVDNHELFHDQTGQAYARVQVAEHYELFRTAEKKYENLLRHEYYKIHDSIPSREALASVSALATAKAQVDGPMRAVHCRIAHDFDDDGRLTAVHLDLCDPAHRAVKVTPEGWKVGPSEVYFRRAPRSHALPVPETGGAISSFFDIVWGPSTEMCLASSIQIGLLTGWIIHLLSPGPYLIAELQSTQGTGKSLLMRLLRSIVDPADGMAGALPKNETDMAIAALNSAVLSFDNQSGALSKDANDWFCRLCTGGGISARKLYSDSDEVTFDIKRPSIINGIENCVTKQDLIDRSISLSPPVIPPDRRRTEAAILAQFKQEHPKILGAFLDVFVQVLKNLPSTTVENPGRMADFETVLQAAQPAISLQDESGSSLNLLECYRTNRTESMNIGLDVDPLASAILEYFYNVSVPNYLLSGNATTLIAKLTKGEKPPLDFPTSRRLRGDLLRIKPALEKLGLTVEISNKTAQGFTFEIRRGSAGEP